MYSKVSVLILRLWLCLVERVGCVRPVAAGIQVFVDVAPYDAGIALRTERWRIERNDDTLAIK